MKIIDNKPKAKGLIFFLILLLAFFLRFWKLNDYPALNADEAAIGYNAYSLIQTGRDEHGNPWPIHFQSFNDYKPGLYFYLVLPFIRFLGLTEWAVRIPSAALGLFTVYLVYLLSNQLSIQKIGLFASFLLAISPWHIHFSRGGWEANVATFLITLGVYLFLRSVKNPNLLNFSSCVLVFVLSLYTYHAARVIVPLLGLGILLIYYDFIKKNIKEILIAGLIGLIFLLPLIKSFTRIDVLSRASGVGLFADTGPLARTNEQRGEHFDYEDFRVVILHNKFVNYGLAFLKNWSEHFHGEFLFLSGDDIQRNKVPETGQMYLFDTIFLLAGISMIVKILLGKAGANLYHPSGVKLILWWLLISPTAASVTFQSPHALRSQNMVIPLTIVSALGLAQILKFIKSLFKARYFLFTFYLFLFTFVFWQFLRYEHMYWVHMAKEYPFSSQYGVKELVRFISEKKDNYQKILVTDRYDQPYILFLFYLKYPPKKFQEEHSLSTRDKYGFSTVRYFDKFEFRQIKWDTDQPNNPNSLIIGTDDEIPDQANVIKEIYGSNNYKYFQIVAN